MFGVSGFESSYFMPPSFGEYISREASWGGHAQSLERVGGKAGAKCRLIVLWKVQ